jgi:hypothetical protein
VTDRTHGAGLGGCRVLHPGTMTRLRRQSSSGSDSAVV